MFCRRPIAACFVADLLRRVVVSSTVSFFMGFRSGSSHDKVRFDIIIISNHVRQYVTDLKSNIL